MLSLRLIIQEIEHAVWSLAFQIVTKLCWHVWEACLNPAQLCRISLGTIYTFNFEKYYLTALRWINKDSNFYMAVDLLS